MTESGFAELHGVVIGLGSIGNRHLNNCTALGVGRMSVVRRKSAQNQQFKTPEHSETYYSLEDALDSRPDFAIVCNPSNQHARTAIECLRSGVGVLIEKPLGRSWGSDEQELAGIAERSEKICAMAYCMRYHPAYRKAHDLVHTGAVGNCLYGKAWFEGFLPDWHPWENYKTSYAALPEQGGGVLRTLDHELDFLNWVLGPAELAAGFAVNTGAIDIEADDLAMYTLRHPGSVTSQITTSFCRKPQSRGFEFVGTTGSLRWSLADDQLIQTDHDGSAPVTIMQRVGADTNSMYLALADDFLGSIRNGSASDSVPLLKSGMDCLKLFNSITSESPCPT